MTDAAWHGLFGTIIGGVIGVAAGWVGPWLLEGRKEAAEKKKKRAQKFEELISALFEHKHWLDMMEQIWAWGMDESRSMSPFAKVHAISRIYFPDFELQITALERAASDYEKWMFQAAEKRVKGSPSIEGLKEAYEPYIAQFRSLLIELGAFAKREFQ